MAPRITPIESPLDRSKRALREAVKVRCRLPAPALEAASSAAQARLLASGLLDGARVIGLYCALPSEVKTSALEEALPAFGARICLPAVQAHQRPLAFHLAGGPLRRGPLGVHEPVPHGDAPGVRTQGASTSLPLDSAPGAPVPLEAIDAFVLPGLAADAMGRRLGRGRGHYDATLALAPRALRILLLLDAGLVPEVPVGEHDALLDAVCTESRLLLCTPRARAAARDADGSGGART